MLPLKIINNNLKKLEIITIKLKINDLWQTKNITFKVTIKNIL